MNSLVNNELTKYSLQTATVQYNNKQPIFKCNTRL